MSQELLKSNSPPLKLNPRLQLKHSSYLLKLTLSTFFFWLKNIFMVKINFKKVAKQVHRQKDQLILHYNNIYLMSRTMQI